MKTRRSWRNQNRLWRYLAPLPPVPKKPVKKKPRVYRMPAAPGVPKAILCTTRDGSLAVVWNGCCGPCCHPDREWTCHMCGRVWPPDEGAACPFVHLQEVM